MKNTLLRYYRAFYVISLIMLFISCDQTITGTGPVVATIKYADKFSKVDLQMDANVTITQGQENSIVVHAQQNITEAIEVKATGKTLKIYSNKYLSPSETIKIDITMNSIEGLEISGSGVISSSGTIKSPEINLAVSGSGKMFLDIVSNSIRTEITGSGEMNLKGSALSIKHETSGSGNLSAYNLIVNQAKIDISGSGNADVTPTVELNGKITGSGSISYKGTPAKIEQKVTGSGAIKPAQ